MIAIQGLLFYFHIMSIRCPKSGGDKSRAPTLCLVCGGMLCSQSYCCQTELEGEDVGACTAHTYTCGCGVGIFLRWVWNPIVINLLEQLTKQGPINAIGSYIYIFKNIFGNYFKIVRLSNCTEWILKSCALVQDFIP